MCVYFVYITKPIKILIEMQLQTKRVLLQKGNLSRVMKCVLWSIFWLLYMDLVFLSLFAGLNFQSSDCSSLEIMSKAALT